MTPRKKFTAPQIPLVVFDLSFRPDSYWSESSLGQALLGNIQGEARRELLLETLGSDNPEALPEGLLEPVLTTGMREALGLVHPMFMGGEYLPSYLPGEVEIARICLASVTADVISIRARPEGDHRIRYRVVDEYEWNYILPLEESQEPLTMGELIRILEETPHPARPNVGLVLGPLVYNLEGDDVAGGNPTEYHGFVSVRSEFYPELGSYFEPICEAYLYKLERRNQDEDCDEGAVEEATEE
jgi:hypothetical protein